MPKDLLQIKTLHVDYGGVQALRNVSLDVREGEIVCVIGGNGAGKTTLANAVCGLVKPSQGEIRFKERTIHDLPPHEVVKLGIIQVPEGRGIFTTLTVLENLKIGAYRNASKRAIAESLEKIYTIFPVLQKRSKQLGGSLSGGEQQMLAIGRGLMAGPQLLLLDEPTLGLSPLMRQEVAKVTQEINRTGTSIILVEQDAQVALRISHKGIVLQNGQVVMQGTCRDLLNDPSLRESYLS
jgi:branched-chain amino acid transport system ATP-binding protein